MALKLRLILALGVLTLVAAATLVVSSLAGSTSTLAQEAEPQRGAIAQQISRPSIAHADQVAPLAVSESDTDLLTVYAEQDTWLDETNPTASHGSDLDLTVGRVSKDTRAWVLLDFDLSALPDDAVIVEATLGVYAADDTDPPDTFLILPRGITEAWNESTANWSNRPATVDLGDPASGFRDNDWTNFDVTHIVRAWYGGTLGAGGIALVPDASVSGYVPFAARTTATPPQLEIRYVRRVVLTATKDTWVGSGQPDTPHGADDYLSVAPPGSPQQERHTLLGFDVSSLPDTFKVVSATLELEGMINRQATGTDAPLVADLYADALLDTWEESTVTWNGAPPSDYLDDAPAEFALATVWDVANIVQSWGNGGFEPHGILLWADPAASQAYGFSSRDMPQPPLLTITFVSAPPDCEPVTSADISGASAGVTGLSYGFGAVLHPADADPPDSISWIVTDYAEPQSGDYVELSWASPGEKRLDMYANHCGGRTQATHTITISDPPPACPVPLRGVNILGPEVVATDTSELFTAPAMPYNATGPFTVTWEATGQAPAVIPTSDHETQQTYLWSEAGSKMISVTVENCGGVATDYQAVEVVDTSELPDLVISNAWLTMDQDQVGYVIRNEGNTTVPPGYYVALEVGPNTSALDAYPAPLGPGQVGVGFLDYVWTCSGHSKEMGVLADWGEDVAELDELNNLWSDTWLCDQQPPEILTGPDVGETTETGAEVSFTTSEACDGWLEYGTTPYAQGSTQPGSGSPLTVHTLHIGGLEGGTTYYVRAFCEDEAGNRVNSEAVLFETDPPGSGPPTIRSLSVSPYPSSYYEYWQVDLELEDDAYMGWVACAMDGTSLGIDASSDSSGAYPRYTFYVSPYELALTRSQFLGWHTFSCTAYRLYPGAEASIEQNKLVVGDASHPIQLLFQDPPPGHKLYVPGTSAPPGTTQEVTVFAAAHEWACTQNGFAEGDLVPPGLEPVRCNAQPVQPVDEVELWLGTGISDTASPGPGEVLNTFVMDMSGLTVDAYELRAVARLESTEVEKTQSLILEQGEPELEVERSIRRQGNTLRVSLDMYNAGNLDIDVHRITDNIVNLQQVYKDGTTSDYTVETSGAEWLAPGGSQRRNYVRITFEDPLRLGPGDSYSTSYVVVPKMLWIGAPVYIGSRSTTIVRRTPGGSLQVQEVDLSGTLVNDPTYGMIPLEEAVANAIRAADYLIVTNPRRVYSVLVDEGQDAEAERLFANMAELAWLENGVLGYLSEWWDPDVLDDLLEPGGSWAEAMNPVFQEEDGGYVLIVGETEIVQSWYVSDFWCPGVSSSVRDSDLYYANTGGNTARPELVVGRVVGNDLTMLNGYMENIIRAVRGDPGYGFDRSHAFVTNGGGENHGTFENAAADAADSLERDSVSTIWIDMGDYDEEERIALYKANMPDQDMVLFNGHGNQDTWGGGLYASQIWDDEYNFGGSNPVMFATSCATGNYESDNDLNLPDVLLSKGAGVYVGATETSEVDVNAIAFINLVPYWRPHETIGQTLNQLKNNLWTVDNDRDCDELWVYETNLYGHPKYGRMNAQAAGAESRPEDAVSVTMAPEGATVAVSLPELRFSEVDGWDSVRIPGGWMLSEPGDYPVPVWTLAVDFEAGQKVQDVQLLSRSGLEAAGGLNLPVVVLEPTCSCSDDTPAAASGLARSAAGVAMSPAGENTEGWYPALDQVLNWSVEENPDGTSTVYVVLYPFYYHAVTGDALYYKKYQLTIETFRSTTWIESLETPWSGNPPGDPVNLEMVVRRTGLPADVFVQASVRTLATNKVLGGLPLMTLHDLVGKALVDITWDTRPYPAGTYQIVVELLDAAGHLLDTAAEEVRLGTYGALLDAFTASQGHFAPGDQIQLNMGVANTGTLPISGTAVFLVQEPESLAVTSMLTVPVEGLTPGVARKVSVIWDSTHAGAYRYRVLGYFKYQSRTTEPKVLILNRPRVLLPVVQRNR